MLWRNLATMSTLDTLDAQRELDLTAMSAHTQGERITIFIRIRRENSLYKTRRK